MPYMLFCCNQSDIFIDTFEEDLGTKNYFMSFYLTVVYLLFSCTLACILLYILMYVCLSEFPG